MNHVILQVARLVLLQFVLLIMGTLFLLSSMGEPKNRFNKVVNTVVGIVLLALCYLTMRFGGAV